MSHPYRGRSKALEVRVIARRSQRASLARLTLASAGLAGLFLARLPGGTAPAVFAASVALWALGRAARAWSLPHAIELDDQALRFAWSEPVTALPWARRCEREVPWASLRGAEARVRPGGRRAATLLVRTTTGDFEVPVAGLEQSAQDIERAIIDARARVAVPTPPPSAFAALAAARFSTPAVLTQGGSGVIAMAAIAAGLIGLALSLASVAPSWVTYGIVALVGLTFGGVALLSLVVWWGQRVIELGVDGIAFGPTRARARLLPWGSLRAVERHKNNVTTTGIALVHADGTRTILSGNYGHAWEALASSIDPDGPDVARVRALIDGGASTEEAVTGCLRGGAP